MIGWVSVKLSAQKIECGGFVSMTGLGVLSPLKTEMKLYLAGIVFSLSFIAQAAETLYDINFSGPGQGVNQTVQTGAAPTQVTSIIYGDPRVVNAFGGLSDQPLHFDCAGNTNPNGYFYDQIQLPIPRQYHSVLDLSFDFTSSGLIGSANVFSVLIDDRSAPLIFQFKADGEIHDYMGTKTVGVFADGETFRFGLHLDYDLGQWTIYRNDVSLEQGYFGGDNTWGLRLSFGAKLQRESPDTGGVAIDNLLVQVPEPAFYGYGLIAVCGWVAFKRFYRPGRPDHARCPNTGKNL